MTLTDIVALVGAVTGPMGLLIAVLVYFRDRAAVLVSMQWDMESFGATGLDPKKTYVAVNIGNIGRRPIYVSHVHVAFPNGKLGLFTSGLKGITLKEGDPPHLVQANQADMHRHASIWWHLRATVIDAAGRHYHSDWPTKAPSWATSVVPPRGALACTLFRNWLRRRLP